MLEQAGLLTPVLRFSFAFPVAQWQRIHAQKRNSPLQWRDRVGITPNFPIKHKRTYSQIHMFFYCLKNIFINNSLFCRKNPASFFVIHRIFFALLQSVERANALYEELFFLTRQEFFFIL